MASERRKLSPWGRGVGTVSALGISTAVSIVALPNFPHASDRVAWLCAMTALVCSAVSALGVGGGFAYAEDGRRENRSSVALNAIALISGGVGSAIVMASLGNRLVDLVGELLTVQPWRETFAYVFARSGWWTLGLIFLACMFGRITHPKNGLGGYALALASMIVMWLCLQGAVFENAERGGLFATWRLRWIIACNAMILLVASFVLWWTARRKSKPAHVSTTEKLSEPLRQDDMFERVAGGIATMILLLVVYQIAVPLDPMHISTRSSFAMNAASSFLAAVGCFLLVSRKWHRGLADVAFGLGSAAWISACIALLPDYPNALAERLPIVFNAAMVGAAMVGAACTWFVVIRSPMQHDNSERTIAEHFVPVANRFAFINLLFAVGLGGLMGIWPRLDSIGTPDLSLGRVTAGFGANLFLLLVSLWSARHLRRVTLHILTLLALLTTIGFMGIRMLPYAQ